MSWARRTSAFSDNVIRKGGLVAEPGALAPGILPRRGGKFFQQCTAVKTAVEVFGNDLVAERLMGGRCGQQTFGNGSFSFFDPAVIEHLFSALPDTCFENFAFAFNKFDAAGKTAFALTALKT